MSFRRQNIWDISTIFFHPDYTVGIGIAPIHARLRSRTLPPIGNFTLPWRLHFQLSKTLYHRAGKNQAL